MQQIPNWPEGIVVEPAWRVTVNGAEALRPTRFSVGRDMTGGLPEQVAGGMGVVASTGTIVWTHEDLLAEHRDSPWDGALPAKGDRVVVEAGYNDVFARVFTGRVLALQGGTDDDVMLKVLDSSDQLRRRVQFPALMATGPRTDVINDPRNYVSPGLSPTYFLSAAAAVAGFHSVPEMVSNAVAYSSMNGSATPRRGTLVRSDKNGASHFDAWPLWSPAPWGQGCVDILADIRVAAQPPANGVISEGWPLKLSLIRGHGTSNISRLQMLFGSAQVFLTVAPGGSASLTVDTGSQQAVSPSVPLDIDEVIVAEYRHDGTYRIRTSGGVDRSGVLLSNSVFRTRPADHMRITVAPGGVQIAATQAWFGDSWGPLSFQRTAQLNHSSYEGSLQGTRSLDTTAIELVNDISAAEMGAAWLDAFGVLQFRNRDGLVSQDPVRVLTSVDDLLSYDWEHHADSVKRSTTVTWTQVVPRRARTPMITIWQGSGETLSGEEPVETIITPGSDEEWLAVDTRFRSPLQANTGFPFDFQIGRWSWSFGAAPYSGPIEEADEWYVHVTTELRSIGQRAWKMTQMVNGEVKQAVPSEPVNLVQLPSGDRGEKLPILRARGHLGFQEETTRSTLQGPDWADEYEHDAGQWIQSETNAQRLADALQVWLMEPMVILRGVRIHPDPRLELGDVVEIADGHAYQRRITALIVGITVDGQADRLEMRLDVHVLDSQRMQLEGVN